MQALAYTLECSGMFSNLTCLNMSRNHGSATAVIDHVGCLKTMRLMTGIAIKKIIKHTKKNTKKKKKKKKKSYFV